MCRYDTAALVDSDVDNDGAFLHLAYHCFGHDLGSGGTRDQDSSNDEVGFADGALDVVTVRGDCENAPTEDVIKFTEAVEVEVEQSDLRAHAERDLRCVGADDAAADDAEATRGNARDSAEQNTAAAVLLLKIGCANLDTHAAGDLAHGGK